MDDRTESDAPSPTNESDEYRFGYSPEEIARLKLQHHVWAQENQRFISRAGFRSGATLVDLGCGPGYTSLDLAKCVGPEGKVIAVDRDGERSLPLLGAQAEAQGISNIETKTANLETFDLQEGSVDGVYARWVLMYLPETTVASLIGRMAKWLRPGGMCALTEICIYRNIHIHPQSQYLPEIAKALMRAVRGKSGCNPEIGNDLPGLLGDAGLEVEINVVTKAVRATTQEWAWPDTLFRNHLPTLVQEGFLARNVCDGFLAEWQKRSREPGAIFFGSPMMEAIGRRS